MKDKFCSIHFDVDLESLETALHDYEVCWNMMGVYFIINSSKKDP